MRRVNAAADADPACLRLSVDTKASVVLGDYSREGKARGWEAIRALDHDLATKAKRGPVGILEVGNGELDLTPGRSAKTSDLLADRLEGWRQRRGLALAHGQGVGHQRRQRAGEQWQAQPVPGPAGAFR